MIDSALPSSLHIVPYGEDLLQRLALDILTRHNDQLPDLSRVTVLLANSQAAARLRCLLLEHSPHTALLGPVIDTLPAWINQHIPSEQPLLSAHQRELMLVEALSQHQYLYGEGNPWTLADSLLELFDALSEVHITLPETLDGFVEQLGSAYGLSHLNSDTLVGEARLVHTLWQAWHQQMQDSGVVDQHTDYLLKLNRHQPTAGDSLYLAGFTHLAKPEAEWLNPLLAKGQAQLYLQGATPAEADSYHPDAVLQQLLQQLQLADSPVFPAPRDDYGCCLQTIYSHEPTALRERARQCATDFPHSPVAQRLSVFAANSAEQEAQAIDLQVRRWWLEGVRNIGIVTENRRLARRVRALLERSGIQLQDAAGWALSTTSAAATLERWLQTVEEDFAYQPLLDLLKSPFLLPDWDAEERLASVYRFEQSIVLKDNVARGLERYRQHLHFRQQHLPAELAADYDGIYRLLTTLEAAAKPLQSYQRNGSHAPQDILIALLESFSILGLDEALAHDAAGQRILEELQHMLAASPDCGLRLGWNEFRTWLGRTLERFNFQPPTQSGQVQLMGLTQSTLQRFEAVIIAGAEREYLPGSLGGSPFFNDGVRQALGLPSHSENLSQRFYAFRALLEAADTLLLTRRTEQDGEEIVASPWLERLQSFHQLAYDDDLIDSELTTLANTPDMQITVPAATPPHPVPSHPRTAIPASLFPKHLSASGYQQLMDCPYQFFAARCLKLEPPESIREMLEKADYGERVHLCLQAFHSGVDGLPGPFTQPLDTTHQDAAIQCLTDIAQAVFAKDLEDNFLHRGWLKRWTDMIPEYVSWQLTRQADWQVRDTETNIEAPRAASNITLRGRLDRVDINRAAASDTGVLGILDYKTGAIPAEADVLNGEAVQLPFYVLLAQQAYRQPVAQVEYVSLDNKTASQKVKAACTLEEDALQSLAHDIGQRLDQLSNRIQQGTAMPAWGDAKACQYCQMSGICRREAWQEEAES